MTFTSIWNGDCQPEPGVDLSPPVAQAMERLIEYLYWQSCRVAKLQSKSCRVAESCVNGTPYHLPLATCNFSTFPPLPMFIELTDQGYLRYLSSLSWRSAIFPAIC